MLQNDPAAKKVILHCTATGHQLIQLWSYPVHFLWQEDCKKWIFTNYLQRNLVMNIWIEWEKSIASLEINTTWWPFWDCECEETQKTCLQKVMSILYNMPMSPRYTYKGYSPTRHYLTQWLHDFQLWTYLTCFLKYLNLSFGSSIIQSNYVLYCYTKNLVYEQG